MFSRFLFMLTVTLILLAVSAASIVTWFHTSVSLQFGWFMFTTTAIIGTVACTIATYGLIPGESVQSQTDRAFRRGVEAASDYLTHEATKQRFLAAYDKDRISLLALIDDVAAEIQDENRPLDPTLKPGEPYDSFGSLPSAVDERDEEGARLMEAANIEAAENELRTKYNALPTTVVHCPYHNEAHLALVAHADRMLKAARE